MVTKAAHKGSTTAVVHGNVFDYTTDMGQGNAAIRGAEAAISTALHTRATVDKPLDAAADGAWAHDSKLTTFSASNIETVGYYVQSIDNMGAGIYQATLTNRASGTADSATTKFEAAVSGLVFPNMTAVAGKRIALIPYFVGTNASADGIRILRYQCVTDAAAMGLNPGQDQGSATGTTTLNAATATDGPSISQFSDTCIALHPDDYKNVLLKSREGALDYLGS